MEFFRTRMALACIATVFLLSPASSQANGADVPLTPQASLDLRVGAWNIKKLGHGQSKDYPTVAKIIDLHFDVMAVVEVMQKGGGRPGYDDLLQALGSQWGGAVTSEPRPNTKNLGSAEFYAILYRKSRATLCNEWEGLMYMQDNDGSGLETTDDIFSREPAFTCLQATNVDAKIGFDFMLAAYHARWAGGKSKDISDEVSHVGKVFQTMAQMRPNEKDLILAGDFNLNPLELSKALSRAIAASGEGSTLNATGTRTENIYDYLLLHDARETHEMIDNPEILDVRGYATTNEAFFKTVSDHLPVVARFKTDGSDDD